MRAASNRCLSDVDFRDTAWRNGGYRRRIGQRQEHHGARDHRPVAAIAGAYRGFDGEEQPADYRARSRAQLQQVQMIYQMADTAINPHQRIRDIIGRPLSFYLGMEGDAKNAACAN